MNTKLKAPSAECAAICEKAVDKKVVNCSPDISPLAMVKSGCRTRPRPLRQTSLRGRQHGIQY